MNYRKDIEKCIKFIEDHIKENITIEEVANQSGYSLYHFCRVFSLCKGVSVMEYIRGRRLSLAAIELYGWHINIVTPELARETIESFKVRGTIKAPSEVQEVLNKLINTI